MRRVGLVMIASFMAAGTLAAQDKGIDKGTVELGGFGRMTKYPKVLGVTRFYDKSLDDLFGAGGRLGYFFAHNLALEVDGTFLSNADIIVGTTVAEIHYTPFHLQLVYNAPIGSKVSWLIGGGGNYTVLRGAIQKSTGGIAGTTGLRWRPGQHVSFRLDGTLDYLPKGYSNTGASKSNTYLGVQLGVSLLLGGRGCNHSTDMISIRPTSANLQPGQTQMFAATATYCGEPDQVVYRLSGVGTLDSMSGLYTATTVGSAQVTAYSRRGKMTSAANITVAAPAPQLPPPPPPPPAAPPPPPPPAPAPRYTYDMQMVHFRFDHADLTKGGQDSVRAIAETLKSHPEVAVDVIGHCDWIGTEAYNMKLSRARAETVRRLLIASGVAADRITVKWRGKDEPIADNHTTSGRAMNRRAEVKQNN
jgi:outer membrane protein OmpA-like peptidoglycan-associated protein